MGLTDGEISEIKAKIERELEEIEIQLQGMAETNKTVELSDPIGRLARVSALHAQQMSKDLSARTLALKSQKQAALRRIELGTYGVCMVCGDDIALKRLKSRPEVTTCIDCANRKEWGVE